MPVYEFQCGNCEGRFEELQRADAAAPPCPSCGTADVTRVLSSFMRPKPHGARDSTWTPAATRRDAVRCSGLHHH